MLYTQFRILVTSGKEVELKMGGGQGEGFSCILLQ